MNNLGKKFDFMIDASSCAAFVWLALSTISSPHRAQTGGERGTATVALVARVLRNPPGLVPRVRRIASISSLQWSIIHDR